MCLNQFRLDTLCAVFFFAVDMYYIALLFVWCGRFANRATRAGTLKLDRDSFYDSTKNIICLIHSDPLIKSIARAHFWPPIAVGREVLFSDWKSHLWKCFVWRFFTLLMAFYVKITSRRDRAEENNTALAPRRRKKKNSELERIVSSSRSFQSFSVNNISS